MLAVLLILMLCSGIYFGKIVGEHNYKNYKNYRIWGSRKRLRSNWEPERPHDLTNSYDNPWDVVSGNTDERKKSGRFGCGGIILIISLLAVIAVILFIIAKRMGLF